MNSNTSPVGNRGGLALKTVCLALVALLQIGLVHAGETVLPETVDYSVLTPAFEGNFFVGTKSNVPLVVVVLGSGFMNTDRSRELRKLVAREHYSATDHLASRLVEALTEAGLSADVEEIPRGGVGTPNRLHRGDLPANPRGRHLINITLENIGLMAATNLSGWEPALWLRWQVLKPDGQVAIVSHKYVHGPASDDKEAGNHRTLSCDLGTFSSAIESPGKIWNCFDLAIREASVAIAAAVKDAQHDG